eukprot:752163-Hanusia_phi.AAC.4
MPPKLRPARRGHTGLQSSHRHSVYSLYSVPLSCPAASEARSEGGPRAGSRPADSEAPIRLGPRLKFPAVWPARGPATLT